MNRGYAFLNQGEIGSSIQDEERALSIFRRRADGDRRTKGFVAHTVLNLAEAQFHQGRRAESIELQQEGQALFQELAASGVPCQAILLRKATRAAVNWVQVDMEIACQFLVCAKDVLADRINKNNLSEGLAIEATRAWKQVEPVTGQFNASVAGAEALSSFSDIVKTCQSGN